MEKECTKKLEEMIKLLQFSKLIGRESFLIEYEQNPPTKWAGTATGDTPSIKINAVFSLSYIRAVWERHASTCPDCRDVYENFKKEDLD